MECINCKNKIVKSKIITFIKLYGYTVDAITFILEVISFYPFTVKINGYFNSCLVT